MILLLLISALLNIVFLSFWIFREKTGNEPELFNSEKKTGSAGNSNPVIDLTDSNFDVDERLKELETLLNNEKDSAKAGNILLTKISQDLDAVKGALYVLLPSKNKPVYRFLHGYAFYCPESKPVEFEMGEGLIGQVAKDQKSLSIGNVPVEHSIVISGLGNTRSQFLFVCPVIKNDQTLAVLEFSFFKPVIPGAEQYIIKAANLFRW